jgi:hypothetical protein
VRIAGSLHEGALHRAEELSDDVRSAIEGTCQSGTGGIHRARRGSATNHEIIFHRSSHLRRPFLWDKCLPCL